MKTISGNEMCYHLLKKLSGDHPEIFITEIGGNCPVQAEGFIGGVPFYFRARGSKWNICIGDWTYEEPYGEGPFDAGWITTDEANEFIQKAASLYTKSKGA